MKILLLCLLLLLLLAAYPVRAAVELAEWRLRVYWLPLPGLSCRVRLFEKDLTPPADPVAAVLEGDIVDWEKLKRPKAADKTAEPPKKRRSLPLDVKRLTIAALGCLHIRRLRLSARLGGDPAATALFAGAGWSALSVALGWLSFNVAAWPKDADISISLLEPPAKLMDSQIALSAEAWLRPGALLPGVGGALLAGRSKRRQAANA